MKQNSHKSLLQFVRYILVGGFNTVFGYGLFALLNWSFTGLGSYSYMYAAVLANVIAITVAFLGYKWFVFRTRGNYLIEYLRCFGVYGSSMVIGLVGLPILVTILRHWLHRTELAPYIAAAMMTVVTVLFSFLGHKSFSFRQIVAKEDSKNRPKTPTI
ncbi:MAG: GtrA family protein [Terracidiphilus sp.]